MSSTRKVRKVKSKAAKRGSRRKVNKWVAHVKAQAKKLGIKYGEALANPQVRAAYRG
jgi:hypothetical protein